MPLFSAFHGKKVLITGHTGFKGSWLTQWLLLHGARVCGYSNEIPTEPSVFEALSLAAQIEDHRGDVRDYEHLLKVFQEFQPEIAFHLAAQPLVRESYRNPLLTFDVNVQGTANFLECLKQVKSLRAALVITTDKVYEPAPEPRDHVETDRLGGNDPYSASKAAAELVFSSYLKSFFSEGDSPSIASVRAGNVIGGGDWSPDRLIPDLIRAWKAGNAVSIRFPEAVRPWQHVLEPLSGYLTVATYLLQNDSKVSGSSFNFGPVHTHDANVQKVVSLTQKAFSNLKVEITPEQRKGFKETHYLRLSWQKAQKILNWSPKLSLDESIDWTLDWYRDFYAGKNSTELTKNQIKAYESRMEAHV
ncbi:MAG: CDP-glucose 4,6-dehydratase [Pseudomonadota bacterium]